MRVLIVDPDDHSARSIEDYLERAGLDVGTAKTPAQLDALLRVRAVDVVICDLSRRRMNGFDIAKRIHVDSQGQTEIVLMSPNHKADDEEIQRLMGDVSARFFFTKPVDKDALLRGIRSPRPQNIRAVVDVKTKPTHRPKTRSNGLRRANKSVTAPPNVPTHIDWTQARDLMQLWITRRTGVLRIETHSGPRQMAIKEGGLTDPSNCTLVDLILNGAKFGCREAQVDGVGDWALLGNQVFMRARSASDARMIRGYHGAVLQVLENASLARSLALGIAVRRLLSDVNGERTIHELLERTETTLGEVSADLAALIQLHFFSLVRADERLGESAMAGDQPGPLSMEISDEQSEALGNATESADLEGLPTLDRLVVATAHRAEDPELLRRRLIRELETLAGAAPPTVLGIPKESHAHLVDEAAARMRQRYERFAVDNRLAQDVRDMSMRMVNAIDNAHKFFDFSAGQQTGGAVQDLGREIEDELAQLLVQGRRCIALSEWEQADQLLSRAHRQQLDHVAVLANLGWARIHNPSKVLERRTEEGRDFLLLAEQFDEDNEDGQYYLAQLLLVGGKLDAAVIRARRAMTAAPGEPKRAALHRKIKIKLEASTRK